jgi:predicted TIM-barrel fold metal-dependent hydrolase
MAPQMKPDDLPMVDAHVHFWDPTKHYYPWLNDEPMIPFRYGDYSAIRRPYYPAEHLADARSHGHNIVKTVYLEAEWDPKDPIGEMEFIAALRKETGSPDVAVGQAWLDRADVAPVLERHAQFPFLRSVRQKPRANASPRDGRPGGMMDPLWREGFARLKPLGLRFDLQTPWWHLHEAVDLAGSFPDTQIILLHSGLPADRSREGIEAWKKQMAGLAQAPNVAAKISGIGVPGLPWTVERNREIVLTIIDLFGPARCMFASNFPVDSVCGSLDEIFGGYKAITAGFSAEERKKMFHDNAIRFYAIGA